jgi:hypothetical protein
VYNVWVSYLNDRKLFNVCCRGILSRLSGFASFPVQVPSALQGHYVTVVDNLFTGRLGNIQHWIGALTSHKYGVGTANRRIATRSRKRVDYPLARSPHPLSSTFLPFPLSSAGHPHFSFREHDVIEPLLLEVDQIYHLACPASPPQ